MNYDNKFDKKMKKKNLINDINNNCKKILQIDIQCNLFEKLVLPCMLYGCEILGSTTIEYV